MSTLEKKKKAGGKRPGAGRPRGTKSKIKQAIVKTKEEALELFSNSAFKMTTKLLQSQMVVATGYHKMVVLERGDGGKMIARTVTDPDEMNQLLETGEYNVDYLVLAAATPDFRAADAILNRALGKPTESLEVGNKDKQPFIIKMDT